MKSQDTRVAPEAKISEDAAEAFEKICGESLARGKIKDFEDVKRMIESSSVAFYSLDAGQNNKWEKAKGVGLKSLKFLKILLGAASQAPSLVCSTSSWS
jgi:hypothetical protein